MARTERDRRSYSADGFLDHEDRHFPDRVARAGAGSPGRCNINQIDRLANTHKGVVEAIEIAAHPDFIVSAPGSRQQTCEFIPDPAQPATRLSP